MRNLRLILITLILTSIFFLFLGGIKIKEKSRNWIPTISDEELKSIEYG
jgi:hypothetical protein